MTVILTSSIDTSSAGFSMVFIPFEAVFSMICQLSSLIFTPEASTSSNDDESELELFVSFTFALEHPLGPGLPSKMLWRFSDISMISSSEHSQSSDCRGRGSSGDLELLLDAVDVGMLVLNGAFDVPCCCRPGYGGEGL